MHVRTTRLLNEVLKKGFALQGLGAVRPGGHSQLREGSHWLRLDQEMPGDD